MKTTTNAQLKLPEYTDVIDIADINENFTKIDGHLGFYIFSENGIHGLRYHEGQLEYYDTTEKKWVAATDEAGAFDSAVSLHNSSETAHADIRKLINDLDAQFANKVSVGNIVNNLTTEDATKILSAAQGVVLKALIDGKSNNDHVHNNYATVDYVNGLIGEVEEVLTEVDTLLGGD